MSSRIRLLRRFRRGLDRYLPVAPARSVIAIHGTHAPSWTVALGANGPVWALLRAKGSAQRARKGELWKRRVFLPLIENQVASVPRPSWSLTPSRASLTLLADKALFADFAAMRGLEALLPRRYRGDDVTYPAVLKRTDLSAGGGIAIVGSAAELAARRAAAPWAGHRVEIQEFIPADMDFVAHLVCVGGEIVWSCAYAYPLAGRADIRGPVEDRPMIGATLTSDDLAAFAAFLRPLSYDGPANIDFRRRPDGRLALFEINPRLGGSLMRPEHVADLAACLDMIVRHARWHAR